MTYHNIDNTRLELEVPTEGLPNLVKNPSGEKGAWFWVTPTANTLMTSTGSTLTYKTTVSQASNFTTDYMPVAATNYVAARFDITAITASHNVKVTFDWYNSAKTFISSSTQSGALSTVGSNYVAAQQAPANTVYVKTRFNFYNGAGNASANATVEFNSAMVSWAATNSFSSTRTNLVRNPSAETNATDWLLTGGTLARSSTLHRLAHGHCDAQAMERQPPISSTAARQTHTCRSQSERRTQCLDTGAPVRQVGL